MQSCLLLFPGLFVFFPFWNKTVNKLVLQLNDKVIWCHCNIVWIRGWDCILKTFLGIILGHELEKVRKRRGGRGIVCWLLAKCPVHSPNFPSPCMALKSAAASIRYHGNEHSSMWKELFSEDCSFGLAFLNRPSEEGANLSYISWRHVI